MAQVTRVLDTRPVRDLDEYLSTGGGGALEVAADVEPVDLIETVVSAGLRGRGGAGFPTGIKWRTIVEHRSTIDPTSVIVNAAEGEPGTFKDRAILRANPYRVLEGALIAARAVGAPEVIVAVKASFATEIARVQTAIDEFSARGLHDVSMRIVEGPSSYLFGEESAMLEVAEGRQPFPRVTPPYRRGIDPAVAGSGNSASWVGLATEDGSVDGPALVDNVETLANVPGIIAEGADWFRSVGTPDSPGTIVCTVVGDTVRHGVGEFAMGTPLWEVIETLGGGARPGRTLIAAISGTANAVLAAEHFETPLAYETMAAAGSGLGAAGFMVFDDETDLVAVAHGISRFLAVESCGQCTPCKQDGLSIATRLDRVRRSESSSDDLTAMDTLLGRVADGARCGLASQQQSAVGSLLELASATVRAHVDRRLPASSPFLVAPIQDLVDGRAVLDESQASKQPDWTTGGVDSGTSPAERYAGGSVDVAVRAAATNAPAASGVGDPSAGDPDPFAGLRALQRRIRAGLAAVTFAPAEADAVALTSLLDDVDRYLDVTTDVIYPALERATGPGRGDVQWAAAHDPDRARQLVATLRRNAVAADDAIATDRGPLVDELASEMADLLGADDEVAFALLESCLDDVGVEELESALAAWGAPG